MTSYYELPWSSSRPLHQPEESTAVGKAREMQSTTQLRWWLRFPFVSLTIGQVSQRRLVETPRNIIWTQRLF